MAASALDSEAAFKARAIQIGVDSRYVNKFVEKGYATYGRYAFAFVYSPQQSDEKPLKDFLAGILEEEPEGVQLSSLRRLFFESHTLALTDVRQRVESNPDPAAATRKLPTAERLARQKEQQGRLGGIIFTPETLPANSLVDLFVEMGELGILSYVKPEQCCSRAQEVSSVKKDPAVSTDSTGLLKLGSKSADPTCEANTELKLRSAMQRRSLAMDQAGLVSFETIEGWIQFLFLQLVKEQPKGFAKVSLQQILDCDKHLFVLASHRTMGDLLGRTGGPKPLDGVIKELMGSNEVLQYLSPLPGAKPQHDPPPFSNFQRPPKAQRMDKPGKSGGKGQGGQNNKFKIPDDAVTHDDENHPLCFGWQFGKCKFKGPPGKRCARGYHKCFKKGCFRLKPYHLCKHTDS